MFDVFISYRHCDAEAVHALADALRGAGLEVWQDASEIEDFASIQGAIDSGLARSKALLAWYSSRYPQSLACQWELTHAFTAAQQEGDPRRRVLLINPEASNAHIHPVELRDALYRSAVDSDALQATAAAVRAHVERLSGHFGDIAQHTCPVWYGASHGSGSSRFFGRLADMWAIHSGLWSAAAPIITERSARPLVRLTGMAGAGKSLTAEMYALRFGAAYPGGIFWLRGYGHDAYALAFSHDELREGQIVDFAQQLDVDSKNRAGLMDALARVLDARGAYLWVVDDLPPSIAGRELEAWLAPGMAGHTLVTTRSASLDWAGSEVRLEDLDETSALALLTHARAPADEDERREALALARDLGCHALALELAAFVVRRRGFAEFRASLTSPSRDVLDFAAELVKAGVGSLPHRDHDNLNLSNTLLMSVDALDMRGKDVLRIASRLAHARIARDIVAGSFAVADGMDRGDAEDAADIAIASVASHSLAREQMAGGLLVHTLVVRTMCFRDTDRERTKSLRTAALDALEVSLGDDIFDACLHAALADSIAHARCALKDTFGDPPNCEIAEVRLLDALYIYDFNHGDYAEARRVAECLIAYGRERLGAEHPHTLIFTSYLGEVERIVGDLASAYDIHYKLLKTRSRLLDPNTLASANNLALVMHDQGNLAGARELQEMIRSERLKHLGEEHPATLLAMHNLALILCDLEELDAACALEERVVELRRKVLGANHRDTREALLGLANIKRRQGRAAEACDLDATVADLRAGGGDDMNPDRLTAMNNLAVSLHAEGKWDEASALMEKVCTERDGLLGPTHPDSVASRTSLAGILFSKGDLRGALECAERALAVARSLSDGGELHLLRAAYYVVLASAKLNDTGSWARIRELADKDLAAMLKSDPVALPPMERKMFEFIDVASASALRAGETKIEKPWLRRLKFQRPRPYPDE